MSAPTYTTTDYNATKETTLKKSSPAKLQTEEHLEHVRPKNNTSQVRRRILNPPVTKSAKHKTICVLGDSHGREISAVLMRTCSFKASGFIKPGAPLSEITDLTTSTDVASLNKDDFAVLIGGSNDVYRNETHKVITEMRKCLNNLTHTNVLIVNIPHRHDLPPWSCVNREINVANECITEICTNFKNVDIVDINRLERRFHTVHGLHLNTPGKKLLAEKICTRISKKSEEKSISDKQTEIKKCFIRVTSCAIGQTRITKWFKPIRQKTINQVVSQTKITKWFKPKRTDVDEAKLRPIQAPEVNSPADCHQRTEATHKKHTENFLGSSGNRSSHHTRRRQPPLRSQDFCWGKTVNNST
ncbi:uncharacterized protein LOC126252858 [Schistocerca nitens]|uniref:uncharacterized protein LOC126252858 n=1 Tax=Schistocerca nitens TaxID=7011 RepID=UPI0021196C18|nr:uncharacterized protein LOC126252858 [Schistocerca nitens]